MASVETRIFDLGRMDALAGQKTVVHELDSRSKLLTTLVFVVAVVSFHRYTLSGLVPFFFYPLFLCTAGKVPLGYLLKKMLIVSPFAVMLGIFNPFLDREVLLAVGDFQVSGGWVSFLSLIVKFLLTVSAMLALVAVTGFNSMCAGLGRLRVPRVLVVQFLFLYRYLFVLVGETLRSNRARTLRSSGRHGQGLRSYGSLVGHLALRTLDRAQRIHLAMRCRGFDGEVRELAVRRWGWAETSFLLGWSAFFLLARCLNLSRLLGDLATGGFAS